jgi:hypothetical protein
MARRAFTAIGGKWFGLAMAACYLWASVGAASADSTLWYSGDFDGNDALYNALVPRTQLASVYEELIVPVGQTWDLTSVFSNNLMDTTTSAALWQIRSGVSNGDGGTLLYHGYDAATQTLTGRTGFGYNEYTVSANVSSLNIVLTAGAYWLTVDPVVSSSSDVSYITTTSGANSVNVQPGSTGNSYVAGSYYVNNGGYNFEPASDWTGYSPVDFSMGVTGTVVSSAVPEPSTLVMGSLGALFVLGVAWRSRHRRS